MSRSTLLGGGGEQTSRLKNSQTLRRQATADVFEQGFTQLSSKRSLGSETDHEFLFACLMLVVASEP